jgi:hypothetical protein
LLEYAPENYTMIELMFRASVFCHYAQSQFQPKFVLFLFRPSQLPWFSYPYSIK